MGSVAVETGLTLRKVRKARGLSLRDLHRRSEGSFKASAVAAYERAERSISLARFCDLCDVYEVDPARLLGDILRAVEGRGPVMIDLTRLEALSPRDRRVVEGFVSRVRALRRAAVTEGVTIRSIDVKVLATASGRREDEFLDVLSPTLPPPSTSTP